MILVAREPFCWLCGTSNDAAREAAAPVAIGIFVLVALGLVGAVLTARALESLAATAWSERLPETSTVGDGAYRSTEVVTARDRAPAMIRLAIWAGLASTAFDLSILALGLLTTNLIVTRSTDALGLLVAIGVPLLAVVWLAFVFSAIRGAALASPISVRRLRGAGAFGIALHLVVGGTAVVLPGLVDILLTGTILANPAPWNDRIAILLLLCALVGVIAAIAYLRASSLGLWLDE